MEDGLAYGGFRRRPIAFDGGRWLWRVALEGGCGTGVRYGIRISAVCVQTAGLFGAEGGKARKRRVPQVTEMTASTGPSPGGSTSQRPQKALRVEIYRPVKWRPGQGTRRSREQRHRRPLGILGLSQPERRDIITGDG